ncbi:DUF397 domain-containing protein [Streptomyces sp. 4N509B]|uniref:DUF397 domain-containing protein n=1 Tax=Streptomyces sp. 4N509B TaxID=3457413 RepID=UPI003FD2DB39
MDHPQITSAFAKSSYSGGQLNDCVAVAHTADGGRAVRDTKRPNGGTAFHSRTAWATFLDAIRADALGLH